jgi:hypothetical protein
VKLITLAGRPFLIGSKQDGELEVREIRESEGIVTGVAFRLRGHRSAVSVLAISSDRKRLVTAARHGSSALTWDLSALAGSAPPRDSATAGKLARPARR